MAQEIPMFDDYIIPEDKAVCYNEAEEEARFMVELEEIEELLSRPPKKRVRFNITTKPALVSPPPIPPPVSCTQVAPLLPPPQGPSDRELENIMQELEGVDVYKKPILESKCPGCPLIGGEGVCQECLQKIMHGETTNVSFCWECISLEECECAK